MVNQLPTPNQLPDSLTVDLRKTPEISETQTPIATEITPVALPNLTEGLTPPDQNSGTSTQEQGVVELSSPVAPIETQVVQPIASGADQAGLEAKPVAVSIEQNAKLTEDAFAQRVEANASAPKEPMQNEPAA